MDDEQSGLFGAWGRKDATLSDNNARLDYGFTQVEIIQEARADRPHCREGSVHGNHFLRLPPREVEAQVEATHGARYLKTQQVQAEVRKTNRELKTLKAQIVVLEARMAKLQVG